MDVRRDPILKTTHQQRRAARDRCKNMSRRIEERRSSLLTLRRGQRCCDTGRRLKLAPRDLIRRHRARSPNQDLETSLTRDDNDQYMPKILSGNRSEEKSRNTQAFAPDGTLHLIFNSSIPTCEESLDFSAISRPFVKLDDDDDVGRGISSVR